MVNGIVVGSVSVAMLLAASVASADGVALGAPRILVQQPAMFAPISVHVPALFSAEGIFDLSRVTDDPVMRARRDFSLMAALPETHGASGRIDFKSLVSTQRWRLSPEVQLTFPLAITGKNLVTAEIGKTQLAIKPTGFNAGGVFTFSSDF